MPTTCVRTRRTRASCPCLPVLPYRNRSVRNDTQRRARRVRRWGVVARCPPPSTSCWDLALACWSPGVVCVSAIRSSGGAKRPSSEVHGGWGIAVEGRRLQAPSMKVLFTVLRAVCTLCLFELGLDGFLVEASIFDTSVSSNSLARRRRRSPASSSGCTLSSRTLGPGSLASPGVALAADTPRKSTPGRKTNHKPTILEIFPGSACWTSIFWNESSPCLLFSSHNVSAVR